MEKRLITFCKRPLKYDYYISDDGKVYSKISNKILSTCLDKYGYEKVRLISIDDKRHLYSVHRLVLENFNPIDNMNNLQVNHIDGNKLNNNLNNLEWVTGKENTLHAHKLGLCKPQYGEYNPCSKLKEYQVKEIIELLLSHKYTYE